MAPTKKMPPKVASKTASSKQPTKKPAASSSASVKAKSVIQNKVQATKTNKTVAAKSVDKASPVKATVRPAAVTAGTAKPTVKAAVLVKAADKKAPTKPVAPIKQTKTATVTAPVVATKPAPVAAPAPHVAVAAKAAPAMKAMPAATAQRAMPAAVSKPGQPKLTAPAMQKPTASHQPPAAAATADANKKPVSSRHGFKTSEFVVYPAHGVGRIVGIEEQEIAGISLELFVIQFEKDKMTLRVPTSKLQSVGMRKLAEEGIVRRAMETLKGKARVKRTMWSRRAQEYEAKINSGDLIAIAEVVRDLYRSEAQPEQSYSERQLYEAALDRMAREIAAVDKLDERGAVQRITEVLSKSARGRRAAEEEAAVGGEVKAA